MNNDQSSPLLPQQGAQADIQAMLLQPATVYANTLRGTIAKLSMWEYANIHGDEMAARWKAFEQWEAAAVLPQVGEVKPHDDNAAIRLRGICNMLGLAKAVPGDNSELLEAQFSVFGMIRAAIERERKPKPQDSRHFLTHETIKAIESKVGSLAAPASLGEAKAVAPEERKPVSGMGKELLALDAIKNRATLAHKLCCGLAPKQAVGELIDMLINMPEWAAVAAGLKEVAAIPQWDAVPPFWLKLYMAINHAVIHAGQYGELEAKSPLIDAVMAALHDIDGGWIPQRVLELHEKTSMPLFAAVKLAVDEFDVAAPVAQAMPVAAEKHLTDADIERGWKATFSTANPYCPCDLKSFTKAVRWAVRFMQGENA